jgi:hypothetical protein
MCISADNQCATQTTGHLFRSVSVAVDEGLITGRSGIEDRDERAFCNQWKTGI